MMTIALVVKTSQGERWEILRQEGESQPHPGLVVCTNFDIVPVMHVTLRDLGGVP